MLRRIEEHDLIAAVFDRLGLGEQTGRVVAAAFCCAGAALGRARVSVAKPDGDGLGAALEVRADRARDQQEETFVRRADAEKRLGRDHERPQIKAAFAAGNPGPVDRHELIDGLHEDGFRQLRQGHARGGGFEALRILVGPEQCDAAVAQVIGLEALEDFLPVVQHGGRGIERDRLAGAHFRVVPAAVLRPANGHHVIGEDAAETRILQQLGARRRR